MDVEWGGDLGGERAQGDPARTILFRGNNYWFCMGADVDKARVTVHVYDSKEKLIENDAWQKGCFAAERILILATDTYYIIVEVTRSPVERTHWAMVYASK